MLRNFSVFVFKEIWKTLRDHRLSTPAKFFEKLTFLTPWFFGKFCARTKWIMSKTMFTLRVRFGCCSETSFIADRVYDHKILVLSVTQIKTIAFRSKKWIRTISECILQSANIRKWNKEAGESPLPSLLLYLCFPVKVLFFYLSN